MKNMTTFNYSAKTAKAITKTARQILQEYVNKHVELLAVDENLSKDFDGKDIIEFVISLDGAGLIKNYLSYYKVQKQLLTKAPYLFKGFLKCNIPIDKRIYKTVPAILKDYSHLLSGDQLGLI
jgi:hypothetical protein